MHRIDKRRDKKVQYTRKVFDLADIVMGRKIVSSLLPQEKYAYYKNHYVPTSNEMLLQKEYLKGGKKKVILSVILAPKLACL